jgi:acyl carrier protein
MDTLELLKEFIKKRADDPPENLTSDTRLDAIGVDSLTLLELIFEMEEKFGIRMPNDMPRPETVGQVVELFEKLKPAVVGE